MKGRRKREEGENEGEVRAERGERRRGRKGAKGVLSRGKGGRARGRDLGEGFSYHLTREAQWGGRGQGREYSTVLSTPSE